jgi:hypothetical protein
VRLAACLVVTALAACRPQSAIPVRWSAPLLELPADADLAAEFNRPFEEPVPVRRGGETAQATGCASAIELVGAGYEPADSADYLYLKNAALHCLILREIGAARPSARSFLADLRLHEAVLPPELEIGPGVEADGEDALAAHPPGFEQRLEILARGDFPPGDGLEDWLVRKESWATEGTAREIRAFILTRGAPDRPLRLVRELTP